MRDESVSSAGGSPRREELLSVQYLRAFAALAVLCFHAADRAGGSFGMGAAGVDIFFTISGFIMWTIAARRPLSPSEFLLRRVERIVPLYWTVTLGLAALALVLPRFFPNLRLDVGHVAQSLLFIPHRDLTGLIAPLLVPGWTLNYEAFFYCVFAGALFFPLRKRWVMLTAALALCVLAGRFVHSNDPIWLTFTNPLLLEFLAGVWLGKLWTQGKLPGAAAGIAAVLCGAAALLGVEWLGIDVEPLRVLYWGLPAALIVGGSLSIERARSMPDWPILKFFGDASYSLYLVHGLAISLAVRMLQMLGATSGTLLFCIALISGLVAGSLCYAMLERPLLRWFHRSRNKVPHVARIVPAALRSAGD